MNTGNPAALVNPATGERIHVLATGDRTDGRLLVLESEWTRPGHRAPEHFHPTQQEHFTVLEGAARFVVAGSEHHLQVGDSLLVGPGVSHRGWNPTDEPVRLRIEFTPALRWLEFVRQLFALAATRPGDYDARLTRLMREYRDEIQVPGRSAQTPSG